MSGARPSKHVELYKLDAQGNLPGSATVVAQYNPTSLIYTITNAAARGSGTQRTQKVDDSTAKLELDLIFDSTDSGEDVRLQTQQVAVLMMPDARTKVPPKVRLTWGAFKFLGFVDSYKETIDYFSENGVPLRAGVHLSMSSPARNNKTPDEVFAFADSVQRASSVAEAVGVGTARAQPNSTVEAPPPNGASATDVAQQLGDPSRGKEIAARNGAESMRDLSDLGSIEVADDAVDLLDAAAFASGSVGFSAGASLSAGAGFSAGAGLSAGASADVGFSAGASAGVGFSAGASASVGFSAGASAGVGFSAGTSAGVGFSAGAAASAGASAGVGFSANAAAGVSSSAGASASLRVSGSASAGVSASEGAFALLRTPVQPARGSIDASLLVVRSETTQLSTGSGAEYAVGGRLVTKSSASYRADVGASSSLQASLAFDEEV